MLEVSCSICLSALEPKGEISSTRCGHVFHTQCVRMWRAQQQTCPKCREPIPNQNIHPLFFDLTESSTKYNALDLHSRWKDTEAQLMQTLKQCANKDVENSNLRKQRKLMKNTVALLEMDRDRLKKKLEQWNNEVETLRRQALVANMMNTRLQNRIELLRVARPARAPVIPRRIPEARTDFKENEPPVAQNTAQRLLYKSTPNSAGSTVAERNQRKSLQPLYMNANIKFPRMASTITRR